MATKAKTTAEKTIGAAEGIESAFKNGTEAFKNSFESAAKNYDKFFSYGRDSVEAYFKAANAAGKGVETLNSELYAFSKQSLEDSMAIAKSLMGTKSVHEALELQTDFAKTAFDAYVGEMTKVGEIVASTAKEAIEPLQARYQAWVEVVQSAKAA
ncbi:MAG: hypothetical protein GC166_08440 [Alphaproteobacteria bacterium]|nr:hypothetical protein [Alphaproteobacteria bacterium]